jgi:regulator of sirC expression with transglutaminase-like and TPR domain
VAAILDDPRQFALEVMQARNVDLRVLQEHLAACQPPQSTTPPSSLSNAADKPTRMPEPLGTLAEQFEHHLDQADWASVAQTAAAIIKAAPQQALGYLLRGRVCSRQAELEHDPELAKQFCHQAIRALERGLAQCPAASEQQPLQEAIAALRRQLGQ